MTLAAADHVTQRFGNVVAVDDVSLDVAPGEILGLLGANGAGKTTLVRTLLGLVPPTAGAVTLFGSPPSSSARRRIGYVPQGLGLYGDLTAEENLRFARAVFGSSRSGRAADMHVPAVPVAALPLGTQRRVAFFEALDHSPELLVLDEPTSGVGPLAATRLWRSVRAACEDGAGAIVTTHNLEEAEQCDRLVVMATGRIVAAGTAHDIVAGRSTALVETPAWAVAFDRLEAAGMAAALVGPDLRVPAAADDVRRALAGVDARVREVPATLEECFLELARPNP